MAVMQGNWQTDLDKWEKDLRELLPGVTLLGELDLAGTDRDQIAAALSSGIAAEGAARFTREVGCRWPVALSAYLVAEGVLSYREGALWPQVCERLGLPKANYPARWGQIFLKTVRRLGKPDFQDLVKREHASRYLTAILAHAEIPNACLPDLFRHVPGRLGRSTTPPRAGDLFERWRHDPQALRQVDRPVRRFLLHGGKIAEDFLDRYLDLIGYARRTGTVPDHQQVGLPARVIAAYRQRLEQRAAQPCKRRRSSVPRVRSTAQRLCPHPSPRERTPSPRRSQRHVASPYLALAPYDRAVIVRLPRQQLSPQALGNAGTIQQLTWTIKDGDADSRISLHLWKSDRYLVAEERSYQLQHVAESYRVSMHSGEIDRKWDLQCLSSGRLWCAFRNDCSMRAYDTTNIPSALLWILVHESVTLDHTTVHEELQLDGEWREFKACLVNLERFTSLRLMRCGVPLDEIALQSQSSAVKFADVPIIVTDEQGSDLPVFAALPALAVPLEPGQALHEQLARWSVTLRRVTRTSRHEHLRSASLAELSHSAREQEGRALVPLGDLLSSPRAGIFELQARRALGKDQTLRFGVIPSLQIKGHNQLILPSPAGQPPPTTISLRCPSSGKLVPEHQAFQVRPERTVDEQGQQLTIWRVDVDNTQDTVTLRYEEQSLSIPLTIPVARLHWRLTGFDGLTGSGSAEVPCVTQDEFARPDDPLLEVSVPHSSDLRSLRVQLRNSREIIHQLQIFPRPTQHPAGLTHRHKTVCQLATFQDTVRQFTEGTELRITLGVETTAPSSPEQVEVLRIACSPQRDNTRLRPTHLPAAPPPTDPRPSAASPTPQSHEPPSPPSPQLPRHSALSPNEQALLSPSAPPSPPRLASTPRTLAAHTPRPQYSFREGVIKNSPSNDPLLNLTFRKAPTPKQLIYCSQTSSLLINIQSKWYEPACSVCGYKPRNFAIESSVEPEHVVFSSCTHRIPKDQIVLGRRVACHRTP